MSFNLKQLFNHVRDFPMPSREQSKSLSYLLSMGFDKVKRNLLCTLILPYAVHVLRLAYHPTQTKSIPILMTLKAHILYSSKVYEFINIVVTNKSL